MNTERQQELLRELERSWNETVQHIKDQHGGQVPIAYVLNNQPLKK